MRKMKVMRRDGGKKSVQVGAVGTVLWNGVTGELSIKGEPEYLAATKAVASLMLVGDQFVNLATVRAELYPVYGNENVVCAVLTMVSANAGEVKAHDPEYVKPKLAALGEFAKECGLLDALAVEGQMALELARGEYDDDKAVQ